MGLLNLFKKEPAKASAKSPAKKPGKTKTVVKKYKIQNLRADELAKLLNGSKSAKVDVTNDGCLEKGKVLLGGFSLPAIETINSAEDYSKTATVYPDGTVEIELYFKA